MCGLLVVKDKELLLVHLNRFHLGNSARTLLAREVSAVLHSRLQEHYLSKECHFSELRQSQFPLQIIENSLASETGSASFPLETHHNICIDMIYFP